ncbi:MAG TPA: hypothetical protein VI953_04220 [Candidatus Paceibacterota bacterium]
MAENAFEAIKRTDDNGREYWSSRELARVLEYTDYRNFLAALNKAKIACENSGAVIHNHFVDTDEMVYPQRVPLWLCANSWREYYTITA